MINTVATITLLCVLGLAALLPMIVFLDPRAPYRWAQGLAVVAVVLICIALAGVVVLVIDDIGWAS